MSPSLLTRKIGSDAVTAVGFGAMGISSAYGKAAPDAERLTVNHAPLAMTRD
jgi:hypothetical protein